MVIVVCVGFDGAVGLDVVVVARVGLDVVIVVGVVCCCC